MPKIDFRPLLSFSFSSNDVSSTGVGSTVLILLLPDPLREKKGMPEGVRRGLRRDLPGDEATGAAAVAFVLLLLMLAVLDLGTSIEGANDARPRLAEGGPAAPARS